MRDGVRETAGGYPLDAPELSVWKRDFLVNGISLFYHAHHRILGKMLLQFFFHKDVPCSRCRTSHGHYDQSEVPSLGGRNEIEPCLAIIAGLHSIHIRHSVHQLVMVVHDEAAAPETLGSDGCPLEDLWIGEQ
jgi:hypothetical protein